MKKSELDPRVQWVNNNPNLDTDFDVDVNVLDGNYIVPDDVPVVDQDPYIPDMGDEEASELKGILDEKFAGQEQLHLGSHYENPDLPEKETYFTIDENDFPKGADDEVFRDATSHLILTHDTWSIKMMQISLES